MRCPNCGLPNPDGKRFCSSCGTAIPPYCPKCGAVVRAGDGFCGSCGAKLIESTSQSSSSPAPRQTHKSDGDRNLERRFLSVLFCDLVDYTGLSERLDPEELRDIIASFRSSCSEVFEQFGGYVAEFSGDGILVYFGYPRSHENDAERAILAGLQGIAAIGRLNEPLSPKNISLAVRIGIASGLVVAGDLVSSGVRERNSIIGQTPSLASRLQGIAQPNSIVIAEDTYPLVQGLFELDDLGPQPLKGFSRRIRAWRVVDKKHHVSRFRALHDRRLSLPMGRRGELETLRTQWKRAQAGDGSVVFLIGEPGIGKSRLVQQLSDEVESSGTPSTLLLYSGSSHGRDSALLPFAVHLEMAFGLARSDSPDVGLDKLERHLRSLEHTNPDSGPLLANLLSIPSAHRYSPLALSPLDQKERTHATLRDLIVDAARMRPVLMVVEDAHWLDPSSQELLQQIIDRIPGLPILMLITARPERCPSFRESAPIKRVMLNPLGREDAVSILQQVVGAYTVPLDVQNEILARTEGVPLFIEELTKAVLEARVHIPLTQHEAAPPAARSSIPATLLGSLTARLDGLGIAKEVAQAAAVIGKEFSASLLGDILDLNEGEVQDAVSQLKAAGILQDKRGAEETTYQFKHTLLQSAAYESLLFKRRQYLHRRIAEALERRHPEVLDKQPDFLAHHYAEGLLSALAFKYWRKAGLKAASMSANQEAIAHFKRCLALLPTMPEDASQEELELELQAALGSVIVGVSGYTDRDVVTAQQRVAELCDKLGDSRTTFHAIFGLWLFHSGRSELSHARSTAERLAAIAEAEHDSFLMSLASHAVGMSAFSSGEFEKARAALLRAIQLGEMEQPHWQSDFQFRNRLPLAVNYLSWSLLILGYPDQALSYSKRISEEIKKAGDAYIEVIALTNSCYLHQFCRNRQAVEDRAATVLTLASEKQFPVFGTTARIFRQWALGSERGGSNEIDSVLAGLADIRATGSKEDLCYFHALGAEILLDAGRIESALELVATAIREAELTGELWYLAELHRLQGRLCIASSPRRTEEALREFERSLQIARDQKARLWELRAATSLYQLCPDAGEGRRALQSICDWFQEGSSLPDLKDARALIE